MPLDPQAQKIVDAMAALNLKAVEDSTPEEARESMRTRTAARLGVDPRRVAVGGDSAGGNLAAVVALMARERGGPALAHQVLIYPVTNHGLDTPSYHENATGYVLTREAMRWFWGHYLERAEQGMEPHASP